MNAPTIEPVAAGEPGVPDVDEPVAHPPLYAGVEAWVAGYFTPMFLHRVPGSPRVRWCARWWDHAEAIARLTVLERLGGRPLGALGEAGLVAGPRPPPADPHRPRRPVPQLPPAGRTTPRQARTRKPSDRRASPHRLVGLSSAKRRSMEADTGWQRHPGQIGAMRHQMVSDR